MKRLLSVVLCGILAAGCGASQQPITDDPEQVARTVMESARATTALTTYAVETALSQADPGVWQPRQLDGVTVTVEPQPTGGTITFDFAEPGVEIDTITVSGQMSTTFATNLETLTTTIETTFAHLLIEVDQPATEDQPAIEASLFADGTVTAVVSLSPSGAACTLNGALTLETLGERITLHFEGVNALLDPSGVVLFNDSIRVVTQHFGRWRVTFKDLLFRLQTGSLDSGRVVVLKLSGLFRPWWVYRFTEPNKGIVTLYPAKISKPFELGPDPAGS